MVEIIVESLRSVRDARFFATERGYQGEFLAELRARLPHVGLPGDAIVEQEYQKRLPDHGVKVRPDIIIHVPTRAGGNRRQGNFAVIELKRRAGQTDARKGFANLDAVIGALDYPLGVFVNIDSSLTQVADYSGGFADRLHFFAVRLTGPRVQLRHAHLQMVW